MFLPNIRNNLGDSLANHVLQAGQPTERAVDIEIDEVHRTLVIEHHLTMGKPINHILEQPAIAIFALAQRCRSLLHTPFERLACSFVAS